MAIEFTIEERVVAAPHAVFSVATDLENVGRWMPNFVRVERSYGSFRRSVRLPIEVDADQIEATFDKGVLEVRLPKRLDTNDRVRKIEVKNR